MGIGDEGDKIENESLLVSSLSMNSGLPYCTDVND